MHVGYYNDAKSNWFPIGTLEIVNTYIVNDKRSARLPHFRGLGFALLPLLEFQTNP